MRVRTIRRRVLQCACGSNRDNSIKPSAITHAPAPTSTHTHQLFVGRSAIDRLGNRNSLFSSVLLGFHVSRGRNWPVPRKHAEIPQVISRHTARNAYHVHASRTGSANIHNYSCGHILAFSSRSDTTLAHGLRGCTHARTNIYTRQQYSTLSPSFQLAVESGQLASFLLALETALDQVAVRIAPDGCKRTCAPKHT